MYITSMIPGNLHHASLVTELSRIFKIGSKFEKDPPFYDNPGLEGAFFNDTNRATALPRRSMMAPGFTREAVRRSETRIAQITAKFLDKLNFYARSRKPLNLTRGSMCLFVDGVMNYAFRKPYGALDAEDFKSELLIPVIDFTRMMQWPIYFPRLFRAVFNATELLPTWALERYFKGILTQKACIEVRPTNFLNSFMKAVESSDRLRLRQRLISLFLRCATIRSMYFDPETI